jgi:PAS domain S-box-containing protein
LNSELEVRVEARTQTLRENQERLKLQERAIAASNNGIIIVDARQPDNPTIFVNPAFEKMSGYSVGEVLGKNCRFLQGQEHNQPGLQILRQALKAGSGCKVTLRNYRKNGSAFWNELNISPIFDDEGALTHYIGIQMDVSQRIQSEEQLKQTNQLLQTISRAQAQFIAAGKRLDIFEGLLSSLLELSNSEYGFIGEVLFRDDGSALMEESFLKIRGVPFLKTHSITNIAWDEATRNFYDEHYEQGMEFNNMNTLFGAVIMTGRPVIANDPQSDLRRGGTPSGHPPLQAFLGFPLFSGAQLIGMVGVANRPEGYDSTLVELLQPFLITCSNLIEGYRLDRQRQSAESRLKASLKEKEILLKEIHHRVKNNLLVVSSLLNWQGESLQDATVLQVFADSQKRIHSLALIHEKLYRSQDLARIDLGDYLESLVRQLYNSLRDDRQAIELQLNLEPIAVNIETATPCGLIANELVCNAFEHAFPNGGPGCLEVSLSRDEGELITLTIHDDGVGFPPNLDFRQTESLGWQLICLLTEQLEGEIQVCSQDGAKVILAFQELSYHNRLESS